MRAFIREVVPPFSQPSNEESIHDAAWFLATSVFIIGLALYVATMCRTVHWWDSGELAATARVLGIAHRPGFPLYILVGRVFGLIPFGDYFYRINFISAAASAASLALLGYVWIRQSARYVKSEPPWVLVVSAALALAAIAGTYSYWIQAVRAEVYAPNLVLIALLLACVWRADRDLEAGRRGAARWICGAGFIAGLGMGLHNATFASVLPAIAIYCFYLSRRFGVGAKVWLATVALAVLGLTVNLYLPIRALQNPPLNWGWVNGVTSPGWSAVAATDSYSYLAQVSLLTLVARFKDIFGLLLDQLQWGLIVVAILGIAYWWRNARRWAILCIGIAFGNVLATAILVTEFSDTNADVHGYLLPVFAVVTFLTASGILQILRLLVAVSQRMLPTPAARHILKFTAIFVIALMVVAPAIIYAPYCNLAHNTLAHDFGTESIANLQADAIVFLAGTNWDFILRGLQYVEDRRTDLTVIDRDLMPSAWYRHWLFTQHPELATFEIPADSSGLHLGDWARKLAGSGRIVYWEFTETDHSLAPYLVPAGHLFELAAVPINVLAPNIIEEQEEFERHSEFYNSPEQVRFDYDAKMVWVMNLYRAGMYYESRGLLGRAKDLYQRALSLRPQEDRLLRAYMRVAPAPDLGTLLHSFRTLE